MKRFSELGIKPNPNRMSGEKIKISRILNKEITVLSCRIEDSKYGKNKSGKCLYLQIEVDNQKHIVFTGSDVLIESIRQVKPEDYPFLTTIIKDGECFEFR